MGHDIGRPDVAELARALRVPVPSQWTVRSLWRQCLERAANLAQLESTVRAADILAAGGEKSARVEHVRALLEAEPGRAVRRATEREDEPRCPTCDLTLAYVDDGDGSPGYRECVRCDVPSEREIRGGVFPRCSRGNHEEDPRRPGVCAWCSAPMASELETGS